MTQSREDDSIWELFDSLIKDDREKKILKLVIDGQAPDEIVEKMLNDDSK
ncbi:MAG: hypothetical protein M1368_05675 [Thaumarchaeota archaeon]|nr:hypothetical protein [Nitrososphaerota archaeon]